MNATRVLFQRFIDYAGLFPPAELDMQRAAEEYGTLRRADAAWMLGRFIVPCTRAAELVRAIDGGEAESGAPLAALAVSLIVNPDPDPRLWMNAAASVLKSAAELRATGGPLSIEMLEAPVPAPAAARDTFDPVIGQFGMLAHNAGMRDLPIFIEFPRTNAWATLLPGAMAALKRSGFGAKIRCGGLVQSAFPTSEELAAFLVAATENDVPFKATAGLHHPVRRLDPGTGLHMHGFLNILAATIFARAGAGAAELTGMLEDEDATAFGIDESAFRYRTRTAGIGEIKAARERFVSYGSCSFEEPVGDLNAMGLLQNGVGAK